MFNDQRLMSLLHNNDREQKELIIYTFIYFDFFIFTHAQFTETYTLIAYLLTASKS